ncbi:VapE domain-containing protein [Primorskyibacter sp. S87]|uniref:VapE domain-containing protein n=1 Tax=Primorskyibacter sp. S87 TaxID=3415126 RepID=UPI003C7D2007
MTVTHIAPTTPNGGDPVVIFAGWKETHTGTQKPYPTAPLKSIWSMLRSGNIGKVSKDKCPACILSTYNAPDARTKAGQSQHGQYLAVPVDIDEGNYDLETVIKAAEQVFGGQFVVYSTSSSSHDVKKWRVIAAWPEKIPPRRYSFLAKAAAALMEEAGIEVDDLYDRLSQPVFLPNVPPDRRDEEGNPLFFQWHISDKAMSHEELAQLAERLDDNAAKAEKKAKAEREERKATVTTGQLSIYDWFNERHHLSKLLKKHGYTKMRGRYLSPYQEGDSPGVDIFDCGERWFSFSSSDQDAGVGHACDRGCYGDAFDIFVHYEFDGNTSRALAEVERMRRQEHAAIYEERRSQGELLTRSEPIPLDAMPHVFMGPRGGITIPQTIENFEYMVNAYGIRITRDVIFKTFEINYPWKDRPNEGAEEADLAQLYSISGLNRIETGKLDMFMKELAQRNFTNPVEDLVQSRTWDGVDRFPELLASIEVDPHADFPDDMLEIYLKRWMVSAIYAAVHPTPSQTRGVLVFTGPQNIGKTTWFQSLIPSGHNHELFKEIEVLDPGNKDDIIRATATWIAEIGELASTFKKADVDRLKAFLTQTVDTIRMPYGRAHISLQRRSVYCGSTNDTNFLADLTGNTRFFVVPVKAINAWHGIDMQQMWAQVYGMYLAGESKFLTREEQERQEAINQDFVTVEPVMEGIKAWIEKETKKQAERDADPGTVWNQIREGRYGSAEILDSLDDRFVMPPYSPLQFRKVNECMRAMGYVGTKYQGALNVYTLPFNTNKSKNWKKKSMK